MAQLLEIAADAACYQGTVALFVVFGGGWWNKPSRFGEPAWPVPRTRQSGTRR
jgi:hypothetical protein